MQVQLKKFMLITYHTYTENGKSILKESYWYEMQVNGSQKLVPQTQEDIHEVRWVDRQMMKEVRSNTFPSIIDVIECVEI